MLPKPTLLSRTQIDAEIWDNHIHHSRQCVIYALSWYLDTVCGQWEALVWPNAANFSIVMPLPVRRKFGRRTLYQPFFCQYLGIFSRDELTTEQCGAFLQALKVHFPYISNYAFNPENFTVIGRLCLENFESEVFHTQWLRLERLYAELFAGYSKDRKVNLKRSQKTVWEIIESDDFNPLIKLFEQNHTRRIGKISPLAYRTLRQLGEKCLGKGNGRLMYACTGACVHAGIWLAHYRGRTIYLFNAADNAGRKGNARALMLDAYFRENAGADFVFDFESPQKQLIANYYAGFGAVATPFYCIKRNALPFPLRQMQRLRKWLIRTRQCLFAGLCRISNPFPATRF